MRHETIPSTLFIENRARLKSRLPAGSLAVVNANDIPPTNADGSRIPIPNSDLFYLTGIEQEETILVIFPDADDDRMREMVFLRETSELIAIWEGHKLTKVQATEVSGIRSVHWTSDFPRMLHRLMCEAQSVWLNTNEHKRAVVEVESRDVRFIRDLRSRYPLHDFRRLAPLLHTLRVVKDPMEVELIRHACSITRAGFERVCQFVEPGVNECDVEAEFAHEFVRRRGSFAYNPIIGSGRNSCVLHYLDNDQVCRSGEVLLLDVAASYANYNSDLTRTIPVNGRFTRRQRQVYDAVLRVLRASIAGLTPGKIWSQWQAEAEDLVAQECVGLGLLKPKDLKVKVTDPSKKPVKKWFMHGNGHPIGLDVHDLGHMNQPFAVGWVMTVEPAIYIPEEDLAVRLENDVLITENGPVDLMADIPIEAEEIEAMMK